jgi:hypothetical protein
MLAAFAGTAGQISSQLVNFLDAYCSLAPARCTEAGLTGTHTGKTNQDVNTRLKTLLKYIKPHNKLQQPKMCANVNECTQAERAEGKVSQATYEAYTHKYNMAFHTCARDGVPQYVRSRLNTIDTAGVYSLAEAWLLLAAVFAWTWAYYIDSRTEESEAADTKWSNMSVLVGAVFLAVAYVMLLIKLAQFFDDLYQKSYQDEQKPSITDDASAWFTFLWWIFAALLAVIFGWLGILKFVKEEQDVRDMLCCGKGKKEEVEMAVVVGDVGYGKPVVASGGQPMQSLAPMRNYMHAQPFNTAAGRGWNIARNNLSGFPEKVKNAHSMRLIETLQRVAPPAQVAQDLAVISGLTTLAIACVT